MVVGVASGYHGAGYHGAGYHGPPALTVSLALTEWILDPRPLAIVALLGGLYLSGVRRLRRVGDPGPPGRPGGRRSVRGRVGRGAGPDSGGVGQPASF